MERDRVAEVLEEIGRELEVLRGEFPTPADYRMTAEVQRFREILKAVGVNPRTRAAQFWIGFEIS